MKAQSSRGMRDIALGAFERAHDVLAFDLVQLGRGSGRCKRTANGGNDIFGSSWLSPKINGPVLHGFNRAGNAAKSGQHDGSTFRRTKVQHLHNTDAIAILKAKVDNRRVGHAVAYAGLGVGEACRSNHGKSGTPKRSGKGVAVNFVVFHN
jgi:hypothetical protein